MSTIENLTEAEVRALRDQVYGVPIPDNGWERCKENWMQPENIRWLLERSQRSPQIK